MSARTKVEIPDKAWLETLKFLMGPQWQKMRFVSHQLDQVVRRNITDLPSIKMERASLKILEADGMSATQMIASGVTIEPSEKIQWFITRGINLDAPLNLQPENAIIGIDMKAKKLAPNTISYQCAEMSLVGEKKMVLVQNEMNKSWYAEQEHQYPVIFYAGFNQNLNEYSWASMEYFVNMIYNPLNYIKQVEMNALDQKLEDAFFVGETYGSYIRCGEFTLQGDIHKSLPWLQKNVRSITIYFPGTFTNSNKEIIDFLLNASSKCASAEVKLEWVYPMEGFIKALIKKFRNITTIENAIPSIWFSSSKKEGERPQLNYLLLAPDITQLGQSDSRNAEAAYIVSNGRNRMQIEIFKRSDVQKLNISANSSKSDDIYDVVIKFSTNEAPMSSQKKVEINEDSWIEALKFLSFAQWSKALFVSRQISRLVQRNVARLPCIVIDNATISWAHRLDEMSRHITAFGDKILSKEIFTKLGISLDAPVDLQHEKVFISLRDEILDENAIVNRNKANVKYSLNKKCFEMRIAGRLAGHRVGNGTIFSAQFDQSLTYSWAAIKYFLEFLYHPAAYVKKVEMFALNQKLIDACFGDAERFIRCGLCKWKGDLKSVHTDDVCKSLPWLEENIRAETILFPMYIDRMADDHFYDRISLFLLDSSWKCARKEVKFGRISNMNCFLKALVKKFRSVSFVRNDIPTFMVAGCGEAKPLRYLLSGPDVKKLKSEDSQGADVCIISNGDNRMQIEFCKRDSDSDDSFDEFGEENMDFNIEDDADEGEFFIDINVRVYRV